jgi:hypothetical protein
VTSFSLQNSGSGRPLADLFREPPLMIGVGADLNVGIRSAPRRLIHVKILNVKGRSKRELGGQLQEPWRSCMYHLAEQGTRNISIYSRWPEELRVIEDVERFRPQL